ncbi:AAA family ATPase [Microbacterium enclense]|uniref:AAA family ATPase n=1 Tax=Microbacterium enclense TaxID=993073 RepID=UPI003F8236EA
MNLTLSAPTVVISSTTSAELQSYRERAASWRSDTVTVIGADLSDVTLSDLAAASEVAGDASFGRVVESIRQARSGKFAVIPSLRAAPSVMAEFLRHEMIDGWLYVRQSDGYLQPFLVVDVRITESRNREKPALQITLTADDLTEKSGRRNTSLYFDASEVARKKPADILLAAGALKETAALRAEYEERRAAFESVIGSGFAAQYRFTGRPLRSGDSWMQPNPRSGVKVVHDIAPAEVPPLRGQAPSVLHGPHDDAVGPVPQVTALRVFDLGTHDTLVVNTADLTEYTYDKSLREKLILPADQRELLDVLTADVSMFVGDIVEGKSAGNVILAKGRPGIGKTLTAEVYAEITERPLYAIHTGTLGLDAETVRKRLQGVFERAKRWDAVLLLDEADVFVMERGANLNQNAIVAEFLRTLEYFDGLLFMTTNRASDIDDAILSRCAAIIDYRAPGPADARKVWQVLAENQGVVLEGDVLDELVAGFAGISPRDVKMLLRLALRVAAHRGQKLTVPLFAQCAMFRGLHFDAAAEAVAVGWSDDAHEALVDLLMEKRDAYPRDPHDISSDDLADAILADPRFQFRLRAPAHAGSIPDVDVLAVEHECTAPATRASGGTVAN